MIDIVDSGVARGLYSDDMRLCGGPGEPSGSLS